MNKNQIEIFEELQQMNKNAQYIPNMNKQQIILDSQVTQERSQKILKQIMECKNIDNPKLPGSLQHDSLQQFNDCIRYNISQNDLNLSQSIFSRKPQDQSRELEGIELEIDYGSFDFQREFYKKYVLMKKPNKILEHEKERYLIVKVQINPQNTVSLTKIFLQDYLTSFRNIYKSFCELRSFMNLRAVDQFYEFFDFKIYVYRKQMKTVRIQIKEKNNDFEIYMQERFDQRKNFDDSQECLDVLQKQDGLKQYIMNIFKNNIVDLIKDITGITDLSKEQVFLITYQEHKEFLMYMLEAYQFQQGTEQFSNDFLNSINFKNLYQLYLQIQ